jgi:hypothetical protein
MCWSQEVSLTLGAVGIGYALYETKFNKDPRIKELTIPLLYFCAMELLQFFSYFYIDDCSAYPNQFLTFLSYIHIAFQPFFFNMMYMYFIPAHIKRKVQVWVYVACAVLTMFMLARLVPFDVTAHCTSDQILCGENFCSVSGDWHIAWEVPLYNVPYVGAIPSYFIAVFILPLIYGSWEALLIGSIFGPGIAYFSTTNLNEQPAIWCLFSVALFLMVMSTRLERFLKVKRWIWWGKKTIKEK